MPPPSGVTPQATSFCITPVRSEEDLADTKNLFFEYARFLNIDLSYQSFDDEMASMPGKYAPPGGELLLARDASGRAIGCVALRPISKDCCEMKRLYVLPSAQGTGLGRALATEIIAKAEQLGYAEIKLDTLSSMTAAIKMYRKFGFIEVPAYYNTAIEGTLFLGLRFPRASEARGAS